MGKIDITFHLLDIAPRDEEVIAETEEAVEVAYETTSEVSDEEYDNSYKKTQNKFHSANASKRLVLTLFGSDAEGNMVRTQVRGFTPFFYLEIPMNIPRKSALRAVENYLEAHLGSECASIIELSLINKKRLFGYNKLTEFPFIQINVPSSALFNKAKRLFLDGKNDPLSFTEARKPRLGAPFTQPPMVYEANLDPLLRFLHLRNISPCNWVTINTEKANISSLDGTIEIDCDWTEIGPTVTAPAPTAPFMVASWDIEVWSSTGEFPLAQRSWSNVVRPFYAAADGDATRFAGLLADAIDPAVDAAALPRECYKILVQGTLTKKRVDAFKDRVHKIVAHKAVEACFGPIAGLKQDERERRRGVIGAVLKKEFDTSFPLCGDPVIQIGTVLQRLGSTDAPEKHIFVLGTCDPIPGVQLYTYSNEADLILAWCAWMVERAVDIFIGYNIFGFDEQYMWKRMEELDLTEESAVQALTRLEGSVMKLEEKRLSSSAMGDNFLYLWTTTGRLRIDVFHHIKRNAALGSYKLDDTSRYYLSEDVASVEHQGAIEDGRWLVKYKMKKQEAVVGSAVALLGENGESMCDKTCIIECGVEESTGLGWFVMEEPLDVETTEVAKWAIVKDDVSPAEMFKLHLGSSVDRAVIAKYCVQDCMLVLDLFKKLEAFNYAMSMANVCSVPVSYIFLRGQGIKIESLIFKYCYEKGYAVQVIGAPKGPSMSYEGAIVLTPTPQFCTVPVGVADFASLYPSTMISENISFDTLVWVKDYNESGKLMNVEWVSSCFHGSGVDDYDDLEDVEYTDIEFDLFIPDPKDIRKNPENIKVGTRVCRYAQDSVGMVPQIVSLLLAARKAKREELKKTPDPFKKALLDSEQNAYKITANSLYGQLGSPTFKLRLQYLAASVTAYGRKQIMFARDVILRFYGEGQGDPRSDATIVYGDTDSLFVCFNPKDPATGIALEGQEALKATIKLTEEAGQLVTKALKAPHDFEFDKVYWPFLIFSKKRYVGHKYEELDHYTQASMGIALKRRDYAPIVKKIYGGAVEILLKEKDVPKAVEFVQRSSVELINGRYGLSPLTISKSLRAEYANPQGVAHKVLADRMTLRDPGTAPTIGDRIPFIYIQPLPGQQAADLQGERIEHPSYIKEKSLKPDYMFYIDHQISNPVCQMFGIMLEKMPGYAGPPANGWPANEDKKAAQKESAAYEILFRGALNAHTNTQKKKFFTLFGSAPVQGQGQGQLDYRPKLRTTPIVQAKPPQKQTLLDSFFTDTMKINTQKQIKKTIEKVTKKYIEDNSPTPKESI